MQNNSAFFHSSVGAYSPSPELTYSGDKNDASALFVGFTERQIQPQGATTYSPSAKNVIFRINSEGNKLFDGTSLMLRGKHIIPGYATANPPAGEYMIIQDGGLNALINQIQIRYGGADADTCRNYNTMHNALFYASSSQSFCNTQGYYMGYYLDKLASQSNSSSAFGGALSANLSGATGGGPPAVAVPLAQMSGGDAVAIPANTTAPIAGTSALASITDNMASIVNRGVNGWVYTTPLSLTSVARCRRYIPLNLVKYIEIVITLEDTARSHFVKTNTGNWASGLQYQLTDLYLSYKLIEPNPVISQQLNALALSDVGFCMALNGFDSTGISYDLATQITPNVTIARSKVKSIWVVSQENDKLSDMKVRTLSTFKWDKLKSYQFQIGSNPLTSYRVGEVNATDAEVTNGINGASEMFAHLQRSLCQWNDHNGFGLISGDNYIAPVTTNGIQLPERFIIGQDFETASNCLSGYNMKAGSPLLYVNLQYYTAEASKRLFTFMVSYDFVVVVANNAVSVRD